MKLNRKKQTSALVSGVATLCLAATASATVLSDLNQSSQLTSDFVSGNYGSPWTHATTGGLGNSGHAVVEDGSDVTMTSTTGYATQVGGSYTVGAYFYNVYNSGFGSLGFSSLSSGNPLNMGNPDNAIGIGVHGGGGEYYSVISSISSQSATWGAGDLASNAWFYAQTTLTFTALDAFSLSIDIWNSDANGVQGSLRASDSVTGTLDSSYTLDSGNMNTLYPYVGTSGSRFTKVDNISTASSAAAAVPEPSALVLLGGAALGLGLRRRRA